MSIEHIKNTTDVAALAIAVAGIVGWLPCIASILSIIWMFMQIVTNWSVFYAKVRSWFY